MFWEPFLCRVFPYLVGREDDNGKGGRFVAALKFNAFQDFEPFEVSQSPQLKYALVASLLALQKA